MAGFGLSLSKAERLSVEMEDRYIPFLGKTQFEIDQEEREKQSAIVRNTERIVESISDYRQTLSSYQDSLLSQTNYVLQRIRSDIEELRSGFIWWMAQDIQIAKTRVMRDKKREALLIDIFGEIRKYDDQKKIEGLIEQGLKDYAEGPDYVEEAFINFQAAEELVPARDVSFLRFIIGHIHLYNRKNPDLKKAKTYFEYAGKYYFRDKDRKQAAESFLHAGYASYRLKEFADAVKHSQRAVDLNPRLLEAYYNHAKFYAVQGDPAGLPSLEHAIWEDREYMVKAFDDEDFSRIKTEFSDLIEKLVKEAKGECDKYYLEMIQDPRKDEYAANTPELFEKWHTIFVQAKEKYEKNFYIDFPRSRKSVQEKLVSGSGRVLGLFETLQAALRRMQEKNGAKGISEKPLEGCHPRFAPETGRFAQRMDRA